MKFKNTVFSLSRLINFITIIIIATTISSCFSIKPSTTKSGNNYYETFKIEEKGTQYFVKPLLFKNKELNEKLIADITFRYKNEIKDSATVNFTIESPKIYKDLDLVKISNENVELKSNSVKLLFTEKDKSVFKSRFTSKFALKEIINLFENNVWNFTIESQDQSIEYQSQKKTKKAIKAVNEKVFVIM